jgi:tRNA A58 N-methylase Trm61
MSMVCPSWLSFILYNPIRRAFTDRNAVIAESGIASASVVIEVGAGNGFFTEVLAEKAHRVYAVELQEGMVQKLQRRVRGRADKVVIVHEDIARWHGGRAFADVCLLYYSLHEVSHKEAAVEGITAMLRPGGLVGLYEPTIEVNAGAMREAVELFARRGFVLEARRDGWFTRFARLRKEPREGPADPGEDEHSI